MALWHPPIQITGSYIQRPSTAKPSLLHTQAVKGLRGGGCKVPPRQECRCMRAGATAAPGTQRSKDSPWEASRGHSRPVVATPEVWRQLPAAPGPREERGASPKRAWGRNARMIDGTVSDHASPAESWACIAHESGTTLQHLALLRAAIIQACSEIQRGPLSLGKGPEKGVGCWVLLPANRQANVSAEQFF